MKHILTIVLSILIFACSSTNDEPEVNVIEVSKFIEITTHIQLAEAIAADKRKNKRDADQLVYGYYEDVLGMFNVSPKKYIESLEYYRKQPQLFGEIFDSIAVHLNKMQNIHAERHAAGLPFIDTNKYHE